MKRVSTTCLIFILLIFSCSKKTINDVSINLILDHAINSQIASDDSLYLLLKPSEYDNSILNIVPYFKKIDVESPLIDSIKRDEGLIIDLQDWISQGKKNVSFFIKKRSELIEKYKINSSFSVAGQKRFVDSFYAKNNISLVVYSTRNDSSLINNLKGTSIKIFSSIESLKSYIIDSLEKKTEPINILYEPDFSIIIKSPVIGLVDQLSDSMPDEKSIKSPQNPPLVQEIQNGFLNHPEKIQPQISAVECDKRILTCLNESRNKEKVEYFFEQIFRFVKEGTCKNEKYKSLVEDILFILLKQPVPVFEKNKNNIYFNLVCSNKTDFRNELYKYNLNVNELEYSKVFTNCPKF